MAVEHLNIFNQDVKSRYEAGTPEAFIKFRIEIHGREPCALRLAYLQELD
jgi:hypothetical protein